jgi:hypothetical protein
MKNNSRKLFLRLALLMALVGGLLALPATLGGNPTSAQAFSCPQCQAFYNECVENCGPPGTPGRLLCIGQCIEDYHICCSF